MRMIEIFTSFESIQKQVPPGSSDQEIIKFLKRLFSFMIDQNYFRTVRKMLHEKIPENAYEEATTRPHNEISRVLLEMIERPLKLVKAFNVDPTFDSKILQSLVVEILTKDFTSTISNFIVPALGSQCDFPFIKLVSYLHSVRLQNQLEEQQSNERDNNNHGDAPNTQNAPSIKFNGNLLYSILKLDSKFFDELISENYLSHYLVIIGAMIGNISKLPKPNQYITFSNYDDDDMVEELSDSDDEHNDEDEEMQPQCERLILSETIILLNEQTRVGKIVKNLDALLPKPEVIHSLCSIAHNLMIYNRAAIQEYR